MLRETRLAATVVDCPAGLHSLLSRTLKPASTLPFPRSCPALHCHTTQPALHCTALHRLGNAFTLWLGINPPELFFYAFLPPLLLDSALSIDYFLFNKARGGVAGWLAVSLPACLLAYGHASIAASAACSAAFCAADCSGPQTCHRCRSPAAALQVMLQVMVFAFLVVLLSCFLATPVLLYGLGLAAHGWRWQHGALFRCGQLRS